MGPGTAQRYWQYAIVSSRPEDLSEGLIEDAQIIELQGLIRNVSNKKNLLSLKESAQDRLHKIYNVANQ